MIKKILKNLTPPIIWNLARKIVNTKKIENKINNIEPKKENIQNIVNTIILENKCIKLHLGCGTVYKDGWINIDNNSDSNIEKLDINWDLRNPLPFPDNTVNFIYNEHFLEHLTVEEGQSAIKDFYRVLKPGGVIRIAMPDLERTIKGYLNENWKEDGKEFREKYGLSFIQTRAERININFRWWGHKWLYDWEELERRLKEAGCEKIKRCTLLESEHIELQSLETRKQSSLIAEVTKP